MSGNGAEELGMGLGNRNEVGELGMGLRCRPGVTKEWRLEMGLRLGNGFGKSGLHEVGEWEWGCGLEMELKKWIGVVEYIYTRSEIGEGE